MEWLSDLIVQVIYTAAEEAWYEKHNLNAGAFVHQCRQWDNWRCWTPVGPSHDKLLS
jgi:hypothetical protein